MERMFNRVLGVMTAASAALLLLFVYQLAAGPVLQLIAPPALAQSTLGALADAGSTLFQQVVLAVAGVIAAAVAALVGMVLKKLFNFIGHKDDAAIQQIERTARDVTHDAILSGMKMAAAKWSWVPTIDGPLPPDGMMKEAVDYAKKMNPDTVGNLSIDKIKDIAISKIPDLIAIASAEVIQKVEGKIKK